MDRPSKIFVFLLLIVVGYVFFLSGLAVCFFMLLTYLFVWPFNKILYRKIVNNLAYMHWSQFTFLGQWWSNTDCTVYMDDPSLFKYVGSENSIGILNHKYEIDWLLMMILAERRRLLGGIKIFGKSSLRFVPLIGWAWAFTESIFLKREWEKDRLSIQRDLQHIKDYPKNYNLSLLLLCEGTRFTEEKHKTSVEFAKKKGLPILKHHLLPRSKGFLLSVQGLKGTVKAIIDMTVAFRDDGAPPTLMNIIMGKPCKAEMFLRRIPLDTVPTATDEACSDWLHKLYKEKDDIYDNFVQNGRYTIGTKVDMPRRPNDLIAFVIWALVLWLPTLYYMAGFLLHGSVIIGLVTFIVIVYVITRRMIAVTETEKGSHYGKTL